MTTTNNKLVVAETILAQLGGNRFLVMTGAKDLLGDENSLGMRIGKNSKGVNKVRVRLTPADLYDVEFFYVRGTAFRVVSSAEGIYAEDLRRVFEAHTGLATSL